TPPRLAVPTPAPPTAAALHHPSVPPPNPPMGHIGQAPPSPWSAPVNSLLPPLPAEVSKVTVRELVPPPLVAVRELLLPPPASKLMVRELLPLLLVKVAARELPPLLVTVVVKELLPPLVSKLVIRKLFLLLPSVLISNVTVKLLFPPLLVSVPGAGSRPPPHQGNMGSSHPTAEEGGAIATSPPPPHSPASTAVPSAPLPTRASQQELTTVALMSSTPSLLLLWEIPLTLSTVLQSSIASSHQTPPLSTGPRAKAMADNLSWTSSRANKGTWVQLWNRSAYPVNVYPVNAYPVNAYPINVYPVNAYPFNGYYQYPPPHHQGYSDYPLPPPGMYPPVFPGYNTAPPSHGYQAPFHRSPLLNVRGHPYHPHQYEAGFTELMNEPQNSTPQDKYAQVEDQEMLDDLAANDGWGQFNNKMDL
ncbi:hypothetical protein DXG01_008304, partial [Tephrocybe rancida]